jgi:branched-chain amino acid transport system permease protein
MFVTNKFYLHNLIMMFFWAALTAAWNIIGGFAGQISLGHAAFFGVGAYTSTILYLKFGVTPWIGIICGGVMAMFVSAIISYPCFKLRGPFFTLSTIAFGEVIYLLSGYFRDLTGGAVGLLIPFKKGFANMMQLANEILNKGSITLGPDLETTIKKYFQNNGDYAYSMGLGWRLNYHISGVVIICSC